MSSKKVPFNRHKENEEARKKREEDEAARVYAEFVKSFEGESASGSKFVRGGVIDPNAKLRADSEGMSHLLCHPHLGENRRKRRKMSGQRKRKEESHGQ